MLFEVKAVPEPIPMQLLELGVPNRVPFETLYVCQPPYVPPLTPARVVHVRPCNVVAPVMFAPPARTEIPPAPTVSAAEVVKLPVILLVPTIDNPPEPFEIWPVEFTCVQDTYPTVELPVTDNPLVEVKPAEVSAPAKLAFPEATVSPLDEVRPAQVNVPRMDEFPEMAAPPLETVRPAQVIAAVGSSPIPYRPMRGPDKAKVKVMGDNA